MKRITAFLLGVAALAVTTVGASAIVDPFEQPSLDSATFGDLPSADTSGELQIPGGPHVEWLEGESPSDYLPLGVIMDSLSAGDLTLNDIGDAVGINPGDYSLFDFYPIEWQTIQHLVDGVPELPNYRVADVKPIFDALGGQYADSLIVNLPEEALAQTLDVNRLGEYSIHDIPNLANTPLDHLDRAGWSEIEGIPGLEDLPLSQYPTAIQSPFWAKVDIVYGDKETTRADTITGSVQENSWSVPCDKPCAYLEMTNAHTTSGNLSEFGYHGKHYIAGDFQQVKGGWAVQESNWVGGYEPTGQLPFGEFAKVSAADLAEQKGNGQLRLNFRYCERSFGVTKACTPYGVQNGIVSSPFLPIKEAGIIPVMALTGAPANNGDPSKEDQAEVDTSDPTKAETGAENPIQGVNPVVTGSSEQGEASEATPPPAEEEECEFEGQPMYKPVTGPITSAYGPRTHPVTGEFQGLHNGMDIGAPQGATMGAAECGKITFAGWFDSRSGNVVIIDHGGGIVTQYLHLCQGCFFVNEGDQVERGNPIGRVGTTGRSTGPHLHFMVKKNGQVENPSKYL